LIFTNPLKQTNFNFYGFGHKLFLIGIFFLASAPLLSSIILLPALIIGTLNNKENLLQDKWNIPFILSSILMILSCIIQYQNNYYLAYDYNFNLSILGLFNWLPLFWCYWGFQPYLKSKKLRKSFLFILVCGSVPLVISGLGQYFLNWYGPFKFLNGFIIFYQRPIDTNFQGLTSFFNNQNYAGAWLSIIFYMSFAFSIVKEQIKLKKLISIFISFLIGFSTLLTYSRNAILSIIVFFLFFIKSHKIKVFISIFFISIVFLLTYSAMFDNLKDKIPLAFYNKFDDLTLENFKSSPRIIIWNAVINLISEKPLFGWGASSFPLLFKSFDLTNINAQHTHNLFLDIALSYGIPSSILISCNLILLTFKNLFIEIKMQSRYYLKNDNIFDTAWKTSTGIFLFSHLFDITYFDARISILCWILFSGMRNILKENSLENINR